MTSIEKICKEKKIIKNELVSIIRRFCNEKNCRLTNLEKSPLPKLCAAVEKYNIPILEIKKKLDEENALQKANEEEARRIMDEKRSKQLKRIAYWNAHPHKMAFVKRFVQLNRQYSDAEIASNVDWNEKNKNRDYILQRSWELMMEQQILGKSPITNHKIDDHSYMVHGVVIQNCNLLLPRRTTKLTEEEIQKEIEKHSSSTYFDTVVECMYMKPKATKYSIKNLRAVNHVFVPVEGKQDTLKRIRINKKLLE